MKLQSLHREFEYMRMKDNESLSDYLTRLFDLINKMKSFDENLTCRRKVQKFFISLSKVYYPIFLVIERTSDLNTVTVQEVVGSLNSYKQRLNRHVGDAMNSEKAFASMSITSKA